MSEEDKSLAGFIGFSIFCGLVATVFWALGSVPWWAIILAAALPTIGAAIVMLLFVAAWMASGSH